MILIYTIYIYSNLIFVYVDIVHNANKRYQNYQISYKIYFLFILFKNI